jgi:acyl-CoA thioester hydrolase
MPPSFVHREKVRYCDIGAFGHVSQPAYLIYAEEARNEWLRGLGLIERSDDMPFIVARAELNFRAMIEADQEIDISVGCGRIGTKSFDILYELRVGDLLVGDGLTTMVSYDYESRATAPLPENWRLALTGVSSPA